MLVALSRSPDPDLALRSLDRLRESAGAQWAEIDEELQADAGFRGRLISVLGSSTALADYLAAHPEQWRRLAEIKPPELDESGISASAEMDLAGAMPITSVHPERFTEVLLHAVGADRFDGAPETRAALRGNDAVRALRLAYRGLLLQVAATDLGHLVEPDLAKPGYTRVAAELTTLAEASLRAFRAVLTVSIAPSMRPERANWFTIDWATMFGEMYVFVAIPWICLITACGPTR